MPNWSDVLNEIHQSQVNGSQQITGALDAARRKYLSQLHQHTGRNVIAYYSGFLSKPNIYGTDLNDEDKNGFMTTIHRMDRGRGLDLLLHTPGGSIAATKSLVHYLHQMFGRDIRAVVPQIAMSAGTMMACSCKSIVMGKQSNLGPVDPQLFGIPAAGVLAEFQDAFDEIKQDSSKIHVWRPILEQYSPTFLKRCEDAVDLSKKFVTEQLVDVMFFGDQDGQARAERIVDTLANYRGGHDRHIHIEECEEIGLTVERLEADETLQDLVLTVHHSFMHTLMNSPAYKIIENHCGVAMVKNAGTPQG